MYAIRKFHEKLIYRFLSLWEQQKEELKTTEMRISGLPLLCCSSHMKGFEVHFDGFLGKAPTDNLLPKRYVKLTQIG